MKKLLVILSVLSLALLASCGQKAEENVTSTGTNNEVSTGMTEEDKTSTGETEEKTSTGMNEEKTSTGETMEK